MDISVTSINKKEKHFTSLMVHERCMVRHVDLENK